MSVDSPSRNRRRVAFAALAPAVLALLASCTELYTPALATAPGGLTATSNLSDRVRLDWDDYNAGLLTSVFYIVLRAEEAAGPFEEIGSTNISAYVDADVGIAPYYYQVVAADPTDPGRTSPASTPAIGRVDPGQAEWQAAVTVAGGIGYQDLNLGPDGLRYLASTGETAESAATLRRYSTADGAWQILAEASGAVDTEVTRPVATAAAGTVPYLFFRDQAAGDVLGTFRLVETANDETLERLTLTPAGGAASHLSATSGASSATVAYVADANANGLGQVRLVRTTAAGLETLASPAALETMPRPAELGSTLLLATFDAAPAAAGTIRVRSYSAGTWSTRAVLAVSGVAADSLAFAADSADRFFVAYADPGASRYRVHVYESSAWTEISPPTAPMFGTGGPVGLGHQGGAEERLYFFFRSGEDGRGRVLSRSFGSGAAWTTFSTSEFTDPTNVDHFQLEVAEGFVYVSYTEAGAVATNGRTRFYE